MRFVLCCDVVGLALRLSHSLQSAAVFKFSQPPFCLTAAKRRVGTSGKDLPLLQRQKPTNPVTHPSLLVSCFWPRPYKNATRALEIHI